MDNASLFLIALAVVLIVVVLFLLRFRSEGGAELSILNWMKLKIWGRNSTEGADSDLSVKIDASEASEVNLGDVVGRDKITQVYGQAETMVDEDPPDLVLRLWDREANHTRDLTIPVLTTSFPRDVVFRIAAANHAESTRAKGIGIRLEFNWRGSGPKKAPRISRTSLPDGWDIENPVIVDNRPAVLRFFDADMVLFHSQPRDWGNFRIRINEKLQGYFLLQYKLSSHEPLSEAEGDLIVRIEYV